MKFLLSTLIVGPRKIKSRLSNLQFLHMLSEEVACNRMLHLTLLLISHSQGLWGLKLVQLGYSFKKKNTKIININIVYESEYIHGMRKGEFRTLMFHLWYAQLLWMIFLSKLVWFFSCRFPRLYDQLSFIQLASILHLLIR